MHAARTAQLPRRGKGWVLRTKDTAQHQRKKKVSSSLSGAASITLFKSGSLPLMQENEGRGFNIRDSLS